MSDSFMARSFRDTSTSRCSFCGYLLAADDAYKGMKKRILRFRRAPVARKDLLLDRIFSYCESPSRNPSGGPLCKYTYLAFTGLPRAAREVRNFSARNILTVEKKLAVLCNLKNSFLQSRRRESSRTARKRVFPAFFLKPYIRTRSKRFLKQIYILLMEKIYNAYIINI